MSATNITTNPFPLGKISPGGSYATTSVPITTNYSDLSTQYCYSLSIRALPGNGTGLIYICNTSAAPDTTNYTNILDVLAAGAVSYVTSPAMDMILLGNYYIGASDGSSAAIVQVEFR